MDDNIDNNDNETCGNDEISSVVYEQIYNLDEKLQDDLDLIALVEGNPQLYDKRRNDYKNVKDRDMTWESIGNALVKPMSGPDAKHRRETLRNLYGRARRQLVSLDKENCLSGSGQSDIALENLLTLQSMAIHRFLAKLYVPRITTSNYKRSRMPLTPASNVKSPATLQEFSDAFIVLSSTFAASVHVVPCVTNAKFNELLSTQKQKASTAYMKQKTQIISEPIPSVNSAQKIAALSSTESATSLCNIDLTNKSESESTSETDDKGLSGVKAKRIFAVPPTDIRKRKKMYDDSEVALLDLSKAINNMCSELPKLLQNTVTQQVTHDTTEDKAMMTVLLQSFKQVPKKKKNRCMMKIFEVIQSFEENTE